MDVQSMIVLAEKAIIERREMELDYARVDGAKRWGRVVAPFDVGSRNPMYRDRNSGKLFAFSREHKHEKTGRAQPMVVAIAISEISDASVLESQFVPEELRRTSIENDPRGYDWGSIPDGWNIARDRAWF